MLKVIEFSAQFPVHFWLPFLKRRRELTLKLSLLNLDLIQFVVPPRVLLIGVNATD